MDLRMNQVTLGATDIEASAAFYEGLGLVPLVVSEDYRRFLLPEGGATLSLHRTKGPVSPSTVVYFETTDLDPLCAELRERGYVFDREPRDERWNWREARLRDPAGNVICLYHAGSDRLDPPWRARSAGGDAAVRRARGMDSNLP